MEYLIFSCIISKKYYKSLLTDVIGVSGAQKPKDFPLGQLTCASEPHLTGGPLIGSTDAYRSELRGLRDVRFPQPLEPMVPFHNTESPPKIKVNFLEWKHLSLCVVTTLLSLSPKYYMVCVLLTNMN